MACSTIVSGRLMGRVGFVTAQPVIMCDSGTNWSTLKATLLTKNNMDFTLDKFFYCFYCWSSFYLSTDICICPIVTYAARCGFSWVGRIVSECVSLLNTWHVEPRRQWPRLYFLFYLQSVMYLWKWFPSHFCSFSCRLFWREARIWPGTEPSIQLWTEVRPNQC